jgi:hypothetical protein
LLRFSNAWLDGGLVFFDAPRLICEVADAADPDTVGGAPRSVG